MSPNNTASRVIAFYLPQYHPIPENDKWWGAGFTEWTNTAKAKPLFQGHYQPHVPADLGFYDLRLGEARIAQAEMAKAYGIEAFCYYHYWFGGKRLLERPFTEVLKSGEPDFPFCLCWANQTWTGVWHGSPDRTLIEQTYPGTDDYRAHFNALLPAFSDSRHVTVDGKPLFLIYSWNEIPDARRVMDFWREMAIESGLKGLYIVAVLQHKNEWAPEQNGFDGSVRTYLPPRRAPWISWRQPLKKIAGFRHRPKGKPIVYPYETAVTDIFPQQPMGVADYPCLIPNWDNTPRSGSQGLVLHGSTPDLFRIHLRKSLKFNEERPRERRIVFLKSWNEWAEGNHVEPDIRYGRGFLEVIRDEIYAQR